MNQEESKRMYPCWKKKQFREVVMQREVYLHWYIQSYKVSGPTTVCWWSLTSCSDQMGVLCCGGGCCRRLNLWLLTQTMVCLTMRFPLSWWYVCKRTIWFCETLLSPWAWWCPQHATKPRCSDHSSTQQPWAILSVPLTFSSSCFQPDLGEMMLENSLGSLWTV